MNNTFMNRQQSKSSKDLTSGNLEAAASALAAVSADDKPLSDKPFAEVVPKLKSQWTNKKVQIVEDNATVGEVPSALLDEGNGEQKGQLINMVKDIEDTGGNHSITETEERKLELL
jgi:hypothetical protein